MAIAATLMLDIRVLSAFRKYVIPSLLLIGLACGPYTLAVAKESHPPVEWSHIPFMFFASVFAMCWVIGLQVIRKDPKPGRWAIKIFYPMAVFMFSCGIGALGTSYYYSEMTPASLLFLSLGAGMLVGIFLMRLVFYARYNSAL